MLYITGMIIYSIYYYPNSTLGNINISELSKDELQEYLNNNVKNYTLTIHGKDIEYVITPDIHIDDLSDVFTLQKPYLWFIKALKENNYSLSIIDDNIDKDIDNLISSCKEPQNAYISYDQKTYIINEEVYGNRISDESKTKLKEQILNAFRSMNTSIDIDVDYKEPSIKKDNPELVKTCNELNEIIKIQYKYILLDKQINIEKTQVADSIKINGSEFELDTTIFENDINELCKKYDNFGQTTKFKTHDEDEIEITMCDYGWKINEEKTKENLKTCLQTKQGDVNVIFDRYADNFENTYGNTYIEINLSNQHLWCYKDGNMVVECDIVSGNESNKHSTPEGIYNIDAVIPGQFLEGEGYKTWVDYWMPFNGNIGIHDAEWRSAFGGEIYKTSGSHGCINCPPDIAKTIFQNVTYNEAVIVYK